MDLVERREAALKHLQINGGRWAYTYRWVANPLRGEASYLGIGVEELVRNRQDVREDVA